MLNPDRGKFNKISGRYELNFRIICNNCKKHICDSDFEIDPKLCLVCSGHYDMILSRSGVKNSNKLK